MKENSMEEDIKIIVKLLTTKFNNDYSIDNKDKEAIEHILTDYKRVLKENKELLEVKVSASAHNRILELEKENEYLKETYKNEKKMKNKYVKLYQGLLLRIKKRIKRYAELQIDYIKKYDEINESLQAMINVLQELLESLESEK